MFPHRRRQATLLIVLALLVTACAGGGSMSSGVSAGSGQPDRGRGTTRTYYVSAEPVRWDYAPAGRNEITGQPFDDQADVFVRRGPARIGSTYLKCLYRG